MLKVRMFRFAAVAGVAIATGFAALGSACAIELLGIRAEGQRYRVVTVNTDSPQLVRDLGFLPARADERLLSLALLPDDSLAMLFSVTGSVTDSRSRVLELTRSASGLAGNPLATSLPDADDAIVQLVPMETGRYIGLVSEFRDVPPYLLGEFTIEAGKVALASFKSLPEEARYANLTHCPNDKIYATSMSNEGATELVEVNLKENTIATVQLLAYNGVGLNRDVNSLVCAPDGTLYALADPAKVGVNSLFRIDSNEADLIGLGRLDVDRIVLPGLGRGVLGQ